MLYDVYIYPIGVVRVTNVEADSMPDAIEAAMQQMDWDKVFPPDAAVQYADDVDGFLVDLAGEESDKGASTYYLEDGVTEAPLW